MLRRLARLILKLGEWTAVGDAPTVPKAVVIAAPHTSNWDALWALTYRVAVGANIHFFGKDTLFWFPLGNLLRALGGVPLDRSNPGAAVAQVVDAFRDNETYYFGLAPEGTRSGRPYWKSGFYRIALQAGVPVVPGFLDYPNRRVGLGPAIDMSGDQEEDLEKFRAFYEGIEARWPDKASPIRFAPDKPPADGG